MVEQPHRGNIYWADFDPARDSGQSGVRPALVVQNDVGNLHSPTTIVVPLTSRLPRGRYPFHVRLSPPLMPKESIVQCNQVRALAKGRLFGEPMASLPREIMRQVDRALMVALGL